MRNAKILDISHFFFMVVKPLRGSKAIKFGAKTIVETSYNNRPFQVLEKGQRGASWELFLFPHSALLGRHSPSNIIVADFTSFMCMM